MRVRQLEAKLEEPGKCQSPIQAGVGVERNLRAMTGGLEDKGLACPARPQDSQVGGSRSCYSLTQGDEVGWKDR